MASIETELDYFDLNGPWSFEEVFNGTLIASIIFSTVGLFLTKIFIEPYDTVFNNTNF